MSSPIAADPIEETDEFDFASLDPANLMKQALGEQTEIPAREPVEPADPVADPAADLLAAQTGQAPEPAAPRNEGVNMRELRKLREAAEKERDQYRAEREALAAKLADLEPRAKSYESEREALAAKLADREKAAADAQAAVWRMNAREKPEWKEKADAIRSAASSVQAILDSSVVKEAGLSHTVAVLFDPSARAALNETIRVLNDNGQYAEAQEIIDSHRAVNAWRGELRKIEEGAAEEATSWQTRREEAAGSVIRSVREGLAAANPVHDTRSPEFLALPKEQQDFLTGQHAAAEQAARESLAMLNKPDALVTETYRTRLALRLYEQANAGMTARLGAAEKELAETKARLAEYEKAAGGGGAGGGGGGGGRSVDPDDPSEVAKMLDPRNMAGYRGMGS